MHWFDLMYQEAIPGQRCKWEGSGMDSSCDEFAHIVLCLNRWSGGFDVEITEIPLCDRHLVAFADLSIKMVEDRADRRLRGSHVPF